MTANQIGSISMETSCKGTQYPGIWEMASRNNPKRGFLFVNRLIGKHIPTYWQDMLMTGVALSRRAADLNISEMEGYILHPHSDVTDRWQVLQDGYCQLFTQTSRVSLGSKVAVIGLCETATGLGYCVSKCIENAVFLRTSRSPEFAGGTLEFQEPHCHAPSHTIQFADMQGCDALVIVDDEVTTGDTVINMVEALREAQGAQFKKIYLFTILNWMSKESLARFRAAGIQVVYLEKGALGFRDGDIPPETGLTDLGEIVASSRVAQGSSLEDGRCGNVHQFDEDMLDRIWSKTTALVWGGGEFIPEAYLLAKSLNLCLRTSTRSPIIAESDRIIRSRITYHNPITDVDMFLYNVGDRFNTLIISESPDFQWEWLSKEVQDTLRQVFFKGIYIRSYIPLKYL